MALFPGQGIDRCVPDPIQQQPPAAPTAPEPAAPAAQPAPADDQFDLGDTELRLQHPAPPRDPDTGRFVKPEETTPPAPAAPRHPDWLTRQAQEMGLDPELVDALDSAKLARLVNHQLRQQLSLQEQFSRQRTVQDGQVQPPPPKEEEPEIDLGPEGEQLDPAFAKVFKGILGKHFSEHKKEVKKLQEQFEARQKADEERQASEADGLIDAAFARLGASYERYFGKGSYRTLQPGSPEMRRRLAALRDAGVDLKRPDRATIVGKLRAAAAALYAPAPEPAAPAGASGYEQRARERPAPQPQIGEDEWDSAALNRPTHRNGAQEPKGEALAVANLTRRMQQAEAAGDQEILDGIPD